MIAFGKTTSFFEIELSDGQSQKLALAQKDGSTIWVIENYGDQIAAHERVGTSPKIQLPLVRRGQRIVVKVGGNNSFSTVTFVNKGGRLNKKEKFAFWKIFVPIIGPILLVIFDNAISPLFS